MNLFTGTKGRSFSAFSLSPLGRMTSRRTCCFVAGVTGAALLSASGLHSATLQPADKDAECDCIFVTHQEIEWSDGPASLPRGAQVAVLQGDPTEAGPFVMRLRFPAGYSISPHFHPAAENITVISGTFNMGKGEEVVAGPGARPGERTDADEIYRLSRGSFAMIPPQDRHYAWTDEPTEIQLHGQGPWQVTYVNPADDPRRD